MCIYTLKKNNMQISQEGARLHRTSRRRLPKNVTRSSINKYNPKCDVIIDCYVCRIV